MYQYSEKTCLQQMSETVSANDNDMKYFSNGCGFNFLRQYPVSERQQFIKPHHTGSSYYIASPVRYLRPPGKNRKASTQVDAIPGRLLMRWLSCYQPTCCSGESNVEMVTPTYQWQNHRQTNCTDWHLMIIMASEILYQAVSHDNNSNRNNRLTDKYFIFQRL